MTDYDKMIDIDGFQVEEILRECLNIEGTPEEIAMNPLSYTGKYLKKML